MYDYFFFWIYIFFISNMMRLLIIFLFIWRNPRHYAIVYSSFWYLLKKKGPRNYFKITCILSLTTFYYKMIYLLSYFICPIDMATASEQLPVYDKNVNGMPEETQFLRRQKEPAPSLAQPKHPHGGAPLSSTHPTSGQHRAQTYGNDNSSVNRQSRVQGQRPDPIPGKFRDLREFSFDWLVCEVRERNPIPSSVQWRLRQI